MINPSNQAPSPGGDEPAALPPQEISAGTDASFLGDTLVGQAIRDSVRQGVPAEQILQDYKNRGPQARADLASATPQVGAYVPVPRKAGFWARLFGRKS